MEFYKNLEEEIEKRKFVEGLDSNLSYNEIADLREELIKTRKEVDKEIIETSHSFYYDTLNCDCNLVVELDSNFGFIPICFYGGKIYSTTPISDERPTVHWER